MVEPEASAAGGIVGIEWPASGTQPKHGIMAQRIAVVAIFVAAGDLVDALLEQVVQRVGDVSRMTRVVDGGAQAFGQADLAIHTLEQQWAKVG